MGTSSVKHIITQLQSGDKSGFIALVDTHKNMVYGLSLKMTQSVEDAEEITQDTFVKVFQSIKSFKGQSKLSKWIYQITYFTAINHLRGRKKSSDNQLNDNTALAENNSLETVGAADQKKFIDLALKELIPQERALITLFYLDEYSMKEVAKICALTESNAKVKIHRTRTKLKTILTRVLAKEVQTLY